MQNAQRIASHFLFIHILSFITPCYNHFFIIFVFPTVENLGFGMEVSAPSERAEEAETVWVYNSVEAATSELESAIWMSNDITHYCLNHQGVRLTKIVSISDSNPKSTLPERKVEAELQFSNAHQEKLQLQINLQTGAIPTNSVFFL